MGVIKLLILSYTGPLLIMWLFLALDRLMYGPASGQEENYEKTIYKVGSIVPIFNFYFAISLILSFCKKILKLT